MSVWVLTDDRVGSSNQAKALASLLGLTFEEKFLKYRKLISFVYLHRNKLSVLEAESLDAVRDHCDVELVISSGRRASVVALGLKELNKDLKVIQILKPAFYYSNFDIVLLPSHDKRWWRRYPNNVVFYDGAISYLSPDKLNSEWNRWFHSHSHEAEISAANPTKFIAVLIGGNSKGCRFSDRNIDEILSCLLEIQNNLDAYFLITCSRRTTNNHVTRLMDGLSCNGLKHHLYVPDDSNASDNPYMAFLGGASAVIVTGDSISMCSEACATGKPVYVYARDGMVSSKHWRYIKELVKSGQATLLNDGTAVHV
ncbi:mitochondrial fission ELM1 family protein [Rickettsiales endosymbiont of Peranema trichophorum]|uniref:mitochondrial fission ELM1 family protein n=1 Tax=Rickettsiales endosymbiont of Peranema trichophorum TaxID=2486577 RepID=UPI0013EE6024|nr:ELM1/GtrOC1 family putative glycosyltransferase [Rickettsiales endosymbiont of Peranema trichophorum]